VSLEQASREAIEAAQRGDLEALAKALEARAQALEAGEQPTESTLRLGQQAIDLLRDVLREARTNEARLRQIEQHFTSAPEPSLNIVA
jgi:hypothetical protein